MSNKNEEGDSPPPPSWIDKAFIQKALRSDGEEDAQVAEITIRFALAPGDNYGSTMYRVKAILEDGGVRSLIVKGPPPGEAMSGIIKEMGLFQREAFMLAEVIPQIQALLEVAAPGRFPPLAARCPLHGDSPVDFLVMEDLALGGFRLAQRSRGLGLRHALLALRNLARLHAASRVLLRRRPELYQRLSNPWRHENPGLKNMMDGGFQAAADACRGWPGFEHYAGIIEKFKDNAMEIFADLHDPRPGGFHVITHGDFWSSNMMFRYQDGVPDAHIAVDLQLSHVASPAADVIYFLSASVSENVHIHHQNLLVREYHKELREVSSLLGLQTLTLQELQAEMNAHGCYASFLGLCGIPIMKNEEAADIEARLQGNTSDVPDAYELPAVKRWLQRVIPEYVEKGWIPS